MLFHFASYITAFENDTTPVTAEAIKGARVIVLKRGGSSEENIKREFSKNEGKEPLIPMK